MIEFDLTNFQDVLPEPKWSLYNEYRRIGTWTVGENEAMLYDAEKQIIVPISDYGERNYADPFEDTDYWRDD